jgi:hypothetical protein
MTSSAPTQQFEPPAACHVTEQYVAGARWSHRCITAAHNSGVSAATGSVSPATASRCAKVSP